MDIDITKVYLYKKQNDKIQKHSWNLSKLDNTHPMILIPKPQSYVNEFNGQEPTYYVILGTSQTYYLRDNKKYLFKKVLNKETYFFSSEIRTIKESDIIQENYLNNVNIEPEEFVKCYNVVKNYFIDIEAQWINEYYDNIYKNLIEGKNMTQEQRQEMWKEIQKLPTSQERFQELQQSNEELKQSVLSLEKSNENLEKSNKNLEKSNNELKFLFLMERYENGKSLTDSQLEFLEQNGYDFEEDNEREY